MQAYHRLVSVLQRIRHDVVTLLDKEAINAACREEKYTWRERLFNLVSVSRRMITRVCPYSVHQGGRRCHNLLQIC